MADRTREALEAAIAADFGDVAVHSAYADYLQEQGDPAGSYPNAEPQRLGGGGRGR